MKITILGSGSSLGVSVICCVCEVCKSNNPKNKRLRSSILIQSEEATILVDTSPDFRYQALVNHIKNIDAVFFTHAHYDHIAGINDLQAFYKSRKSAIPIYSDDVTIKSLEKHYSYIFNNLSKSYQAFLKSNILEYNETVIIKDIKIEIFEQIHGQIRSIGLKINDKIAYSTDVSELPIKSVDTIKNIDVWIVDCIIEQKKNIDNFAHADLEQVMEWVGIIKPSKVILTHLGHSIDYDELARKLPDKMSVAYDRMNIFC